MSQRRYKDRFASVPPARGCAWSFGRLARGVIALGVALGPALAPGPAHAFDLYSFFDSSCRRQTGILVHVDATQVVVAPLDGKPIAIPRATVRSLVLHQVLENPLAELTPSETLWPFLRQVWTEKTERPTFSGWVAGFHDDLLIFFDFEGKSHVLQADEIIRIRPFRPSGAVRLAQHRVPRLTFPQAIVPCGSPLGASSGKDVMPSRVIADRIKIDDLLTALADRYRGFAGLEERTRVYARPYHYTPTLRLGLTYAQNSGFAEFFPFYFNYTGGTPYRFQSRILLGSIVHDSLPFLRRSLAAASDIKSHFFHATFVGQLPALPAETDAFLVDHGEIKPYTVTTSYNYLILMGLDYWRLSASAGPAYFSLRVAGELEGVPGAPTKGYEVTAAATSVTPVFRLQYRADRWTARALYYRTRLSGAAGQSQGPVGGDYAPGTDDDDDDVKLRIDSDVLRLGVTASLPLRLTVSVDQILSFISAEAGGGSTAIEISYFQSETALMISAEFGRYIAVKAFARLLLRSFEQRLALTPGDPQQTSNSSFDPLFGGVLEFVF